MIGKASIYINLSISILLIALGFYSLFIKGNLYKDDIIAFVFIEFIFGVCLIFDIYCISLQRNNTYGRVSTKRLIKKGKILFVLGILAAVGSALTFASLIYSLSEAKYERSKSIIIIQIFTVLILLLHSLTTIFNLIQYKKLQKINRGLQVDIIDTIGENLF